MEHWPQGVTNWPYKFDGILFGTLGPIQGHKVQHSLVARGRLKSFFSLSALTHSVKRALVVPYKVCLCYFKILLQNYQTLYITTMTEMK